MSVNVGAPYETAPILDAHDGPWCAETHISWVLLTADRALKVYKPVRTDVLDHRRLEDRRVACAREVALNRRLAADVYEGVAEITLDGEAVEPVILMHRMPASRRLTALLDDPESSALVRSVARTIAVFHTSATVLEPDLAASVASAESLRQRWAADIAALRDLVGPGLRDQVEAIAARAHEYLAGRDPLLRHRIGHGFIRDGHGDLLADDIFCLDDGPRILDCLAFCDQLRWGDVLSDVAFLVMDLQRLGHPRLARQFLHDYCEFGGEHHPGSLAHLYVSQRAVVRAKVAALRAAQTDAAVPEVMTLLDLALDHLQRAEITVALVGGVPGSGKSTLANRMSDEFGWAVLSSDDIRRDLGLRYRDLQDATAYDPETVAKVYDEMCRRAAELIGHGVSVILDATWTCVQHRQQARDVASLGHARILETRCQAPLATCRQRVRSRSNRSSSEATPDVVDVLAARAEPWPEATLFNTADMDEPPGGRYLAEATALWWKATAREHVSEA